MRLKIKIGFNLRRIVNENFVHRNVSGAQRLRSQDRPDHREILGQALDNDRAIGIDDDLGNLRNVQQRVQDVMIQRFPGQHPVIFPLDTNRMMTHGDKCHDFRFRRVHFVFYSPSVSPAA